MKYYFCILFLSALILNSCSSTKPRKRDIVAIQLNYDTLTDLEIHDTLPIQVALKRRDGKLNTSKRNFKNVKINSKQGYQKGKTLILNREQISKNNNRVDGTIHYLKDGSIQEEILLDIPYLVDITTGSPVPEVCLPGKTTQCAFYALYSSGKKYKGHISNRRNPKSKSDISPYLFKQMHIATNGVRLTHDGFTPVIRMDTIQEKVSLQLSSKYNKGIFDTLQVDISYNVQEHFSYNAHHGRAGRRGSAGSDGTTGNNGSNGKDGSHGQDGFDGYDVTLFVFADTTNSSPLLKIWSFTSLKRDSCIIDSKTGHLHISTNGGNGGDGGIGGAGGDGGDADSTHSSGDGGNGGHGGDGGNGGRGGSITLYCDSLAFNSLNVISYENYGGIAGNGGAGGRKGSDGSGDSPSYKTKAGAILGTIASVIFSGGDRGDKGRDGINGRKGADLKVVQVNRITLMKKLATVR